jgi:hypothetical protein
MYPMKARGAFSPRLAADRGQIGRFVAALFRYADEGTVVSLRAFRDDVDGTWGASEWPSVRVNAVGLEPVAAAAPDFAERCAAAPGPVVFAPPIATFRTEGSAAEKDVANGLVLTVECDKNAPEARALLERLIGAATLVVASGGQWVDPDTGEITPKLHLHWRLKEPTRTFADHQKLKQARLLAQRLVGSDASAVPLVHPIRWPGSWHRKAEPRLAKIVGGNVNAEIELADAYERLCEAAVAAGQEKPAGRPVSSEPQADEFDIIAALQAIPNNDVPWDEWNRIGLATWRATGGSEVGFAAFAAWSAKSGKNDPSVTRERWAHFAQSPPSEIGAGTLFFLANQARPGWRKPSSSNARSRSTGEWPEPDPAVLRLYRREPPELPLDVFCAWGPRIARAAGAASCPVDYVAAPLLASASVQIGNARWAQAAPGWAEPPHLWCGNVGDSGDGKSPGSDSLMRDVLPVLEQRMAADFPNRLSDWRLAYEQCKAKQEIWKAEVRDAEKAKRHPPAAPDLAEPAEPQMPRLRQHDVTIEKVAELLSRSAPKGLLIVRDELAGWILGMNSYNDAGRAFWIEAYGGRPYSVDRKSRPDPILIPRLVVAVIGNIQPSRLTELLREADDGLLSRILWGWPNPVPFRLPQAAPDATWVINALDRLRMLEPQQNGQPIFVPLADNARPLMERFANQMQAKKGTAGGLLRSAYGKARGQALRLSLNLEMLWWCARDGFDPAPTKISAVAFAAAAQLMNDYYMPMAERVYGDAGASEQDQNAATLARWILKSRPKEVHVRHLQREVHLPGLATAKQIHAACAVLVEAGWLKDPQPGVDFGKRGRNSYPVNPRLRAGDAGVVEALVSDTLDTL